MLKSKFNIWTNFNNTTTIIGAPMGRTQCLATCLLLIALLSSLFLISQAAAVSKLSESKLNSRIIQESIIHTINSNPEAGWKAAVNPKFSNFTVGQFKHLLGARSTPASEKDYFPLVSHSRSMKLPAQFDARTAWPQCSTISRILDQGHCGSCWAFGAVESLSDRFCIHHGMNVSLSVNDLLSCCGFLCGSGCNGGYPLFAWRYFVHHGVVTEECDPYFDDKGCSHPGCEPAYPTPKCKRQCMDGNQLWRKSKHFGASAYKVKHTQHDIMAELYKNGPVEVSYSVYEDFAHYKSGVYKHITGSYMGGHAVKLIGWGTTEAGEDYWLVANQWNRSWGENGYFKIKRGTNECGIEAGAVAGLPSSKNLIKESADIADAGYAAA